MILVGKSTFCETLCVAGKANLAILMAVGIHFPLIYNEKKKKYEKTALYLTSWAKLAKLEFSTRI